MSTNFIEGAIVDNDIKYIDRIGKFVNVTVESDPKMKTKHLSISDVLISIKQLQIGAAVVQAKPSEYQLRMR